MDNFLIPLRQNEIKELLGEGNIQEELNLRFISVKKDIEKGRPFQIAKEAWEYAFADAVKGEWVGNGNNPEDVRKDNKFFDIKGLSGEWEGISSEASIRQSLKNEYNLDENFQNNNSRSLWNSTVLKWIQKIQLRTPYYIMVFWRNQMNVRLVGFRVNETYAPIYVENECNFNATKSKLCIKNILNEKFGRIYILKSKKRLEMRIDGSFFNQPEWHLPIL